MMVERYHSAVLFLALSTTVIGVWRNNSQATIVPENCSDETQLENDSESTDRRESQFTLPHSFKTTTIESRENQRVPEGRIASLYADRMQWDYLMRTLSPVAGMMFAPTCMQLAFSNIVNHPIDEHQNRLLHVASRSKEPFFNWMLLQLGASTSTRNRSGWLPLDFHRPGIREADDYITIALSPSSLSIQDIAVDRPKQSAAPAATSHPAQAKEISLLSPATILSF